jgi:hypothetical protein
MMTDALDKPETGDAPETGNAPATAGAPASPFDPGAAFTALRTGLPDELRRHPSLASYTSFEGLARSHVAAQRMIGKRIADATPEELGRYYARHGRPAAPEAYQFGAAEEGGVSREPTALDRSARKWFHEAGLSQHQAEILYDRWTEFAEGHARDADIGTQEARAAAERELRSEWGRTYDRRIAAAARAVAEFGGEPLARYLDETGLGNDPRLVRAFARIAEMVGEDALIGESERDFAVAPDAAREEIARALREPAYFDANHPEHDASVTRMRTLFASAYPSAAVNNKKVIEEE